MAEAAKDGRAWQRMLSGRRLDLIDPSPFDIEIEDIALGLSREARWNGQTVGSWAFTVAQHSILVERALAVLEPGAPADWRLAALLHDAPEFVIGDLISPFKAAVGIDYQAFEARLQAAIHLRFGLPARLPAALQRLIKRADRAVTHGEAVTLAGFQPGEATRFFGRLQAEVGREIAPLLPAWAPDEARARFLARFAALGGHKAGAT